MIVPTIGRKVWFWPAVEMYHEFMRTEPDDIPATASQPHDATVVTVHDAREVNLRCSDRAGASYTVPNVQLLQDDDPIPTDRCFATWMPYQVKAAKSNV